MHRREELQVVLHGEGAAVAGAGHTEQQAVHRARWHQHQREEPRGIPYGKDKGIPIQAAGRRRHRRLQRGLPQVPGR